MDKIARIRQEIERRINILTNVYAEEVERKDEEMMNYYHGKVIALEELRPFLDTLSEEPDKSLEEAAEEYTQKMLESWRFDSTGCRPPRESFKAGAEWQARQLLQGSPMPEDTVLFNKGVAEGRRLEREDMLKETVEAEVHYFGETQGVPRTITIPRMQEWLKPFKDGDKVRIVVLKEEED